MTGSYELSQGCHPSPAEGRCAMEWVAYIAGEEHSDSPACVSPLLQNFGIALNDGMPHEWRQKLRPYLARMIGTADDGLDQQRLYLLADWAVRVIAPKGLEARERQAEADVLRALPPVVDRSSAAEAAGAARAARAAWAAGVAGHEIWQSALDILNKLLPTAVIDLPEEINSRAVEICGAVTVNG